MDGSEKRWDFVETVTNSRVEIQGNNVKYPDVIFFNAVGMTDIVARGFNPGEINPLIINCPDFIEIV